MSSTTRMRLREETPPSAPDIAPGFAEVETASHSALRAEPDFVGIAMSPEFQRLRGRLRRFVFPMSALFLLWYLTYVVVAAYQPAFMSTKIVGEINVGLLMGVGQFASTIAITAVYLRFAARRIDPLVTELRQENLGG